MKTDEILNLDCTKSCNMTKLNRFLYKIPAVLKHAEKKSEEEFPLIDFKVLEECFNKYHADMGYSQQGIKHYYEDGVFIYYHLSLTKRVENLVKWKGNVYGKTLWELFAKTLIKIYDDIIKEERGQKNG